MKARTVGVGYALAAAALFGASTPLSKLLLDRVSPAMLAGLLYLGSGLGLAVWRALRPRGASEEAGLRVADLPWLGGAILFGGVLAPLLLMVGLGSVPAATASLLLNLEGVFTALLAWFVFGENFDRRVMLGMISIVGGGVILSTSSSASTPWLSWGALLVVGACLAWALDNNLTRRVAASDPVQITMAKGLAAGAVNVAIALGSGQVFPAGSAVALAGLVGLLSYGVSLTFFVLALRHIGTARTSAYFSVAPFVGVVISVAALGEALTARVLVAGALMGLGVWFHLTEHHEHEHHHPPVEHEHAHSHDDSHHAHAHDDTTEPHVHRHHHPATIHCHPHYPDTHHFHEH